jgi:glycosyltransferase involved in cell wall biosynthesis
MATSAATDRPVVSVLMPVVNPHPVYFRRAVGSVLGQSLRDFELVIVEDPSNQEAAPMLAELDDGRIRHIRNSERTGLVRQLNQGLKECRAELVARMDGDDEAEPERFHRQVDLLTKCPDVSVVGTQLRIIDDASRCQGYRAYPTVHADILGAFPRYNPMAHPSVMFRRAVVAGAGGYTADLHNEDYDLWSRLAVAGHRFANLPDALLSYRVHAGAVKSTRLRTMIRGTLEVKQRYWMDRMTLRDRLRLFGERCLLALPARLVMELFKRTAYQAQLSGAAVNSPAERP